MDQPNELMRLVILFVVSALVFLTTLFVPVWRRIKKEKEVAEEKRALREKNPISLDRTYFFARNCRIEILVDDFDVETGMVSGDVFLHVKADDTILNVPSDNDLNNIRLPVRHTDGTFETLSFDIAGDKPKGFDGWELEIYSVFAKAG